MWNITTLFISFDQWSVELYRTGEYFPTLLSLKIKLRKNYPDFLILTMLYLYCDLFFFASYMFVRVLWVDWKGQYDSECEIWDEVQKVAHMDISIHVLKVRYLFCFLGVKSVICFSRSQRIVSDLYSMVLLVTLNFYLPNFISSSNVGLAWRQKNDYIACLGKITKNLWSPFEIKTRFFFKEVGKGIFWWSSG